MRKDLVRTSKFLSLVLRHKPEVIGLTLDSNGWVEIEALLHAASNHQHKIIRETLDEVVFTNDKQRFSFSPDGTRIRANQGHSIDVNLELEPVIPPSDLYHGTVVKVLDSVREFGLLKMQRQHVHLSATVETARSVGSRRGKPVVLSVDSVKMHEDGFRFFLSANGVWLTDSVPWMYIAELTDV